MSIVDHNHIDCEFQLLTVSCKATYIVELKIINYGFQLFSSIASSIRNQNPQSILARFHIWGAGGHQLDWQQLSGGSIAV